MNILFTMCGRAGSKGVKNKNIRDFIGYPLVYYTLSAIDLFIRSNKERYENIDIALNTDSMELVQLIENTNISYHYIPRKEELATDSSSKLEVIKDTLRSCENKSGIRYDYIIDLDLTSPLRTVNDIEKLIYKMESQSDIELVFSVTNARRNPYFNMVMEQGKEVKKVIESDYTARQQAPTVYDMNASMYIYKNEFLSQKNNRTLFDAKINIINMLDTGVLDIDHEEDLELMQVIASYFYNKYPEYKRIRDHIRYLGQREEG